MVEEKEKKKGNICVKFEIRNLTNKLTTFYFVRLIKFEKMISLW